jgi:hypothetical protein
MREMEAVSNEIKTLIKEWEPKLIKISGKSIFEKRNHNDWTIKQTLGHLIDSASNNTHRIIHLQYEQSPINFPDYANLGNNDNWIIVQHYQEEDWQLLVQLWKQINLHLAHIIQYVDPDKLDGYWVSALGQSITLNDMIRDYSRHLKLHLNEIEALNCE